MKARKISLLGTFILCLTGIAISNLALAACPVDPNVDYGSKLTLSIRDCTGVLPEDNCAYSASPVEWYEEACLGKDQDESISITGFGSGDGSVQYDGPAALPTMRQTVFTSPVSRNGSTMESWQVYTYGGENPIILPIVADLTYEYSGGEGGGNGLNQGWFVISLTVWDASMVDVTDFRDFTDEDGIRLVRANCGDEWYFGLPDGAIIANTFYQTDGGPAAPLTLDASIGCDGNDVIVDAGDSFIVATMGQTIADRGGFVDMGHTLAVKFAEDTPPEVLMALVDSIVPACDDCGPEQVTADVQIKTGGNSCLETNENGMIFVNILGSDTMDVSRVRIDESLILGSLDIPLNTQLQKCKEGNINEDDFVDLNCKFKHGVLEANNEEPIKVLLRGKMIDGTPIEGIDTVCLAL
jgi:hypothetical protein